MKKILIALILLYSMQLGAQIKEVTEAVKLFERAKNDSQNPKKAENPQTWLKLSAAYTNVYEAPIKSLWLGASRVDTKILLKDHRIESTEDVKINDQLFTVDNYSDKKLYYGQNGELVSWVITNKYVEADLLDEAYKAIETAIQKDSKKAKIKEITEQLSSLKNRYFNEAMCTYALGNFKESSIDFEKAANLSEHNYVNAIDTALIYYAGLTAYMSKDHDRAIGFFKRAIDLDYDSKGDAYSYLGECYKVKSDVESAKEVLNTGFRKYPSNQSILVSLINSYIESNDDPNKILELIRQAQINEPMNATLYYAEGNVYKNIDEFEKAIKCYEKSVEIDSKYYYGYFAIGAAYYDRAVDIQVKATEEMDDAKYEALVVELEKNLEMAIEPFEKCFSTTSEEEIKKVVAEYLKNIYFRFREKGDEYLAGYEKYKEIATKE